MNEYHEQTLQHGASHVRIRYFPQTGLVYMRQINLDGTVVPSSQELVNVGDYPGFECLHDGVGWHPSLPIQLLRIYDDAQESDTLPYFIHHHYNKNGQTPV